MDIIPTFTVSVKGGCHFLQDERQKNAFSRVKHTQKCIFCILLDLKLHFRIFFWYF